MSSLPIAFTAVGSGPLFRSKAGESFTYTVTGTFVGTWILEKTDNGGKTWTQVATGTSTQAATVINSEKAENYRFRCSDYTSGTITATLADASGDVQRKWENSDGVDVLAITDEGITTPKATVTDLVTTNVNNAAGDNLLQYVDVVVSAAQILALNATPIEIVAAPGASKVLMFHNAVLFLDYNSAAYAGIAAGEDLNIRYEDASGQGVAFIEATGFLDATNDAYRIAYPVSAAGGAISSANPTAHVNEPLVLHMATGEITTGNSPLAIRVYYSVVDLSTLLSA